ncbi:MAG TPA: biotin/lipoyl-binding protein, partial [Asanoa sp.]|nr:biotin/lipoyl-binding protein [Asanoa sp.]
MPVSLRPSWFVNGLLGVALIGGGLWAYSSFDTAEANGASGTGTRTVPVSQGTVIATVTASGSVRSASTATAAFGTAGTVTAIKVKVGDTVKKGTVLAAVDDTGAKRQLAAAQGDLDAAQDALARANDADGDTSTAQTQVDQAELDVSEAQDGVDGTTLIAPMAGTVTAVNGTLGGSSGGTASTSGSGSGSGAAGSSSNAASGATSDSSSSGSGFVTIEDLTKLEVTASVAEADATRLKAGQVATVAWNALPDARADATLAAIDPNPTTANDVVTYGVTFGLASLPEGIRSGQTVEVSVVVGQVENALSVVSAAITSVGNRHTVTLDKNGQHVAQ